MADIPILNPIPPDNSQYLKDIANTLGLLKDNFDAFDPEKPKPSSKPSSTEEKKTNFLWGMFKKHAQKVNKETVSILNTTKTNLVEGLKTPFSLILDPLKDLTGFSLTGEISKALNIGKKDKLKPKQTPTKSDLAKTEAGQALLYELNQKKKGGKDGKGKGGFLGLFGGGLGAKLAKALPIAGAVIAIAAGLIWATVDAIKGVMMAKKWGVSKVSAGIGSFLGGTGSGIKNAFKNAGKWALIGAGTGFLVGGPVGALAGGLIGAAIGGVLGYIGGEKLSKITQTIGNFFNSEVETEMEKKKPILSSAIKSLTRVLVPIGLIENNIKTFKVLMDKEIPPKEKVKKISLLMLDNLTLGLFKKDGFLWKAIINPLGKFKGRIKKGFPSVASGIRKKVSGVIKNIGTSIFNSLDSITGGKLTKAKEALKEIDPFGKIQDFVIKLKDNILGFITSITDFFGFLGSRNIFKLAKSVTTGKFGEDFQKYREVKMEERGMVDGSLADLNYSMDEAEKRKAMRDQAMIEELKKLNKKDQSANVTTINNVKDSRVDTNSYRRGLNYRSRR